MKYFRDKIYITYSTDKAQDSTGSEKVKNALVKIFQEKGIRYRDDKEQIASGDSLTEFMNEIGYANYVIAIIDNKYLKSPFCMYELNQVYTNCNSDPKEFTKRVLFFILKDTNLDKSSYKELINLWGKNKSGLFSSTASFKMLDQVAINFNDIISAIAQKESEVIDINSFDRANILLRLDHWIKDLSEPNLELIVNILKHSKYKNLETDDLIKRYPNSHLVQLFKYALILKKGINLLTRTISFQAINDLTEILESKETRTYKTAFCLRLIFLEEYYHKWSYTPPELDYYTYELTNNKSPFLNDFFIGLKISPNTIELIKQISSKY
ncbi:MAG: toll/interleukin-1 receptor domain-containing protein [Bacteroidota bacterium]